jgi:hypothetical protein
MMGHEASINKEVSTAEGVACLPCASAGETIA